jgi:hypothetical protein
LGPSLATCDLRLERADEHLTTLNALRDEFIEEHDRRIVGYFDDQTSEYVFRVSGDPPKPSIGLVVSELGHHLRATLDNLLWQLVLLRGGSPDRSTQFPIYECRKRYQAAAPSMLHGTSADDRAYIKSIQPYRLGPHAAAIHPLALIGWLNNTDKHHILHVGCTLPVIAQGNVAPGVEVQGAVMILGEEADPDFFPWWPRVVRDVAEVLDTTFSHQVPTDDRTELMRVRIRPSGPDPQMEMQSCEAIDISFSDRERPLMLHDLATLRSAVQQIRDRFRPEFPA